MWSPYEVCKKVFVSLSTSQVYRFYEEPYIRLRHLNGTFNAFAFIVFLDTEEMA